MDIETKLEKLYNALVNEDLLSISFELIILDYC